MIFQIFIVLVMVYLCILQWKKRKFYKLAKVLKLDVPALPIVGHMYKFIGDDENRMTVLQEIGRIALKNGGLTSAWMGQRIYLVCAHPETAEFLLKSCLEKDQLVKMLRYVVGYGSVFAPVPIWRPRRKALVPTFSQKSLDNFVTTFAEQSLVMVEQIRKEVGKSPFSLWGYMSTYAMDTLCETSLGITLKTQKNPDQPFLRAFEDFFHLIAKRLVEPWLHNDFLYFLLPESKILKQAKECMNDFVNEIILRKRKQLNAKLQQKKNGKENCTQSVSYKTLLDLLMRENILTDEEIKEEVLVLAMAGTDTSSTAACFTALLLSRYPDVQDKVYQELREVFSDDKRLVNSTDLLNLVYLEAVIKETLRLFPPVPIITRFVTEDVTLPSGIVLPKGCGILVHQWAMHRDTEYWGPDAEEFRPERFLNMKFKHPTQYIPFSFGLRNCVGYKYAMMSTKTALATLLLHYKVLPASELNENMKLQPLRLKFCIMMKDVDNYMIRLEKRL